MKAHLGELGQRKEPVELTFDWFGATIRTNPDASPELEITEFMQKAALIEVAGDDPSPEDLAAAAGAMDTAVQFLRGQLHPEDWPQFWQLAKANRQKIDDLMTLGMRLVEAVSGFPTAQPSVSSGGRLRTKKKSRGGSSSRVTRALRLVSGRPDLQTAIMHAEQARQDRQAVSA